MGGHYWRKVLPSDTGEKENHSPEAHILNAMKEWSDNTCITFREKTNEDRDYVHFVSAADGV